MSVPKRKELLLVAASVMEIDKNKNIKQYIFEIYKKQKVFSKIKTNMKIKNRNKKKNMEYCAVRNCTAPVVMKKILFGVQTGVPVHYPPCRI